MIDTLKESYALKRDLNRLIWMVGFNIAMNLAILWRVFAHGVT